MIVTSRVPIADTRQTSTCSIITAEQIQRLDHGDFAEILKKYPSVQSEPKPICPPPDENPSFQLQLPILPSGSFRPLGIEGGSFNPAILPTQSGDDQFQITPSAGPNSVGLDSVDQSILDYHNSLRAEVGARPLRWDPLLASHALDYARELAETRQLIHARREGRGIERENLLQANIGWSPDRMMQSWAIEKQDFVAGYYPNVARDGNWLRVSHYTQMIWLTTTAIGCGSAEGGGYIWLVCRYSPGGNTDGRPVGIPNPTPERG